MTIFRLFLIACLLVILVYTGFVVLEHGLGLFAIFFGDIMAMGWPGQFNLDFFTFLLLSGLWTAWRNDFSPVGLGLALIAVVGGMVFLSIYLLFLTSRHNSIEEVILGNRAKL